MSPVREAVLHAPPETATTLVDDDPWRIGWRYLKIGMPDGTVEYEQVPLTEDDLLHPQEDDFVVTTTAHGQDLRYIHSSLKWRYRGFPRRVVLVDCRVDFEVKGLQALGPDITVLDGVIRRAVWATFRVKTEGARTLMAVEETSPSTRNKDLENKPELYHRAAVPYYVIIDVLRDSPTREIRFIGYRYEPEAYVRMANDPSGDLTIEELGIRFTKTADGYVRLVDLRTGEIIPEESESLELAEATAQVATAAFEQAEARAKAETRARKEATRAREQAEVRAKAEAVAREQAVASAKAEAVAREQAEANAKAEAVAREQAEAIARAEAAAREQAEAGYRERAEALAKAEERIRELERRLSGAN